MSGFAVRVRRLVVAQGDGALGRVLVVVGPFLELLGEGWPLPTPWVQDPKWDLRRAEQRGTAPTPVAVHLLGCRHSLLAHLELFTHQSPRVLPCRAALSEFFSQSALTAGVPPTQVQHPALGLVEPH